MYEYYYDQIDFICSKGSKKYYIQSAYSMETIEKQIQEKKSLIKIKDNYLLEIEINDKTKELIYSFKTSEELKLYKRTQTWKEIYKMYTKQE